MTTEPTGSPGSAARADRPVEPVDVAVIGGGQAGLAIGHLLARRGLRFLILEAGDAVGSAWRSRWGSLVLFTPARYSGLPGLPFPGNPDHYPTRDEVIAYPGDYARRSTLPVALGRRVRSLAERDGRFVVSSEGGPVEADEIVIATGPVSGAQRAAARRPACARGLPRTRRVQAAAGGDRARTGRIASRPSLQQSELRQPRGRDTLIGSSPRELRRRYGITLGPRVVDAEGRALRFADGSALDPDAVIWATGCRRDYSWIELPVLDAEGRLRHRRGVTEVPGLYVLGLTWQHTRGSALIGWVEDDARFIAAQVEAHARGQDGFEGVHLATTETAPRSRGPVRSFEQCPTPVTTTWRASQPRRPAFRRPYDPRCSTSRTATASI